jgi:hypothetical protein
MRRVGLAAVAVGVAVVAGAVGFAAAGAGAAPAQPKSGISAAGSWVDAAKAASVASQGTSVTTSNGITCTGTLTGPTVEGGNITASFSVTCNRQVVLLTPGVAIEKDGDEQQRTFQNLQNVSSGSTSASIPCVDGSYEANGSFFVTFPAGSNPPVAIRFTFTPDLPLSC